MTQIAEDQGTGASQDDALAAGRVRVFRFALYDIANEKFRISERMATADVVARLGGLVITDGGRNFRIERPATWEFEAQGDIVVSGASAIVDRGDLESSPTYDGMTAPGFWREIGAGGGATRRRKRGVMEAASRKRVSAAGTMHGDESAVAVIQRAHKNPIIQAPTPAPPIYDTGTQMVDGPRRPRR